MSRNATRRSTLSTRSRSARGKRTGAISKRAGHVIDRSSRPEGGVPFEPSSGNVYRDLGFSAAEAEYLSLRSRLMLMVSQVVTDRGLTQSDAAQLLGVSQPRVSDVIRGRIERFTIDALVEMLARAGVRLDVVKLPASA